MKLLINHVKRWNKWMKYNTNSRTYQLLVLLGLRHSPTFAFTYTDEETEALHEAIIKGIDIEKDILFGIRERVSNAVGILGSMERSKVRNEDEA